MATDVTDVHDKQFSQSPNPRNSVISKEYYKNFSTDSVFIFDQLEHIWKYGSNDGFASMVCKIAEQRKQIDEKLSQESPAEILANIKLQGFPANDVPQEEFLSSQDLPVIDVYTQSNEDSEVTNNPDRGNRKQRRSGGGSAWAPPGFLYSNPFDPRLSFNGLLADDSITTQAADKQQSQNARRPNYNCLISCKDYSDLFDEYLEKYHKSMSRIYGGKTIRDSEEDDRKSAVQAFADEIPAFVGNDTDERRLWADISATKYLWTENDTDLAKQGNEKERGMPIRTVNTRQFLQVRSGRGRSYKKSRSLSRHGLRGAEQNKNIKIAREEQASERSGESIYDWLTGIQNGSLQSDTKENQSKEQQTAGVEVQIKTPKILLNKKPTKKDTKGTSHDFNPRRNIAVDTTNVIAGKADITQQILPENITVQDTDARNKEDTESIVQSQEQTSQLEPSVVNQNDNVNTTSTCEPCVVCTTIPTTHQPQVHHQYDLPAALDSYIPTFPPQTSMFWSYHQRKHKRASNENHQLKQFASAQPVAYQQFSEGCESTSASSSEAATSTQTLTQSLPLSSQSFQQLNQSNVQQYYQQQQTEQQIHPVHYDKAQMQQQQQQQQQKQQHQSQLNVHHNHSQFVQPQQQRTHYHSFYPQHQHQHLQHQMQLQHVQNPQQQEWQHCLTRQSLQQQQQQSRQHQHQQQQQQLQSQQQQRQQQQPFQQHIRQVTNSFQQDFNKNYPFHRPQIMQGNGQPRFIISCPPPGHPAAEAQVSVQERPVSKHHQGLKFDDEVWYIDGVPYQHAKPMMPPPPLIPTPKAGIPFLPPPHWTPALAQANAQVAFHGYGFTAVQTQREATLQYPQNTEYQLGIPLQVDINNNCEVHKDESTKDKTDTNETAADAASIIQRNRPSSASSISFEDTESNLSDSSENLNILEVTNSFTSVNNVSDIFKTLNDIESDNAAATRDIKDGDNTNAKCRLPDAQIERPHHVKLWTRVNGDKQVCLDKEVGENSRNGEKKIKCGIERKIKVIRQRNKAKRAEVPKQMRRNTLRALRSSLITIL